MKRILKTVAINLGTVLVIFWTLNLISSILLESRYLLESVFVPEDDRVELPNYRDEPIARTLYAEMRELRTSYAPYVAWTRREIHGETINVDSEGDRVHTPTTDSPIATVRFFGGSSMWGTGAADDETIPAQWNRLNRRYEVHNHGESGFVSRQSLARLVNLVNRRVPMDLVVFYDGSNDVGSLCRRDVRLLGHTRENKLIHLTTPPSDIVEGSIGSLMQVLRFVIKPEVPASRCETDSAYAAQIAEVLLNNWKIARAVAKEGGAEFLAVLQPVAWYGSPRTDHIGKPSRKGRQHRIAYPIVRERLLAENADWILDFSRAFDGDEYIFVDTTHVSSNGNRIIAEKLEPYTDRILQQQLAQH